MMDSNSQPLGYKPSALAIELNSSKPVAVKELSLSSILNCKFLYWHWEFLCRLKLSPMRNQPQLEMINI